MRGLDRWITGNYGEDQYAGLTECPQCGCWHPNQETCWRCKQRVCAVCLKVWVADDDPRWQNWECESDVDDTCISCIEKEAANGTLGQDQRQEEAENRGIDHGSHENPPVKAPAS